MSKAHTKEELRESLSHALILLMQAEYALIQATQRYQEVEKFRRGIESTLPDVTKAHELAEHVLCAIAHHRGLYDT